ncbi:MAG: hypothetical protein ACXVXZ_13965 [Mycobacteriaceae bacterium]
MSDVDPKIPGMRYDLGTKTLVIETHEDGWSDVSIALIAGDRPLLMMVSTRAGGRVEDGMRMVERIIVRRPAGNEQEIDPRDSEAPAD